MKKIFVIFFSVLLFGRAFGADNCTSPKAYTVDKRCYVTDEQKTYAPYNAVVAVLKNGKVFCTGTIVNVDGKPYLYTAKHCVREDDGVIKPKLLIRLQDGREIYAIRNNVGDYETRAKENYDVGDWAVYSLTESNVPMVKQTMNNKQTTFGIFNFDYLAKMIGYGSLKIMSDAEIAEFKQRYMNYLKAEYSVDSLGTGHLEGFREGGFKTQNKLVAAFIKNNKDYWRSLVNDINNLKVSYCTYSSTGKDLDCQGWGGNSGGGIFDKEGRIMAIHTRGQGIIGGGGHARADGNESLLRDAEKR